MNVQKRLRRTVTLLGLLAVVLAFMPNRAAAQYTVTNLVTNQTDPDLINPWGMSYSGTGPIWVSDNGTGLATYYDNNGNKEGTITIPPGSGNGLGSPTGQVPGCCGDFVIKQGKAHGPASFIFATADGTISGYNGGVNPNSAVIKINNPGNSYYGLAMGVDNVIGKLLLFAADFRNDQVDRFDRWWRGEGSFTDSKLVGLSVYNVENIGGNLYVAFSDTAVPPTKGAIDMFSTHGKLIKHFSKSKKLKGPWGMALAPANFGPASNALLVGNVGDGTINYFNATTGKFMGKLKDTNNKVISIPGLWGLTFGSSGSNGNPSQLFFTGGGATYTTGVYGVINFQ